MERNGLRLSHLTPKNHRAENENQQEPHVYLE